MEILGRNIPQLQSAISSGFDNVTAGITESVKASGVSAIDNTFQIFSASQMGIAMDTNFLPAVANAADYPDPITALAAQSNSSSDTASASLPLLQTMQNPKFTPEAELSTFTEAKVNETFKDLAKVRPDKLGDIYYGGPESDPQLPYVSAANGNLQTMPNKAESESAESRNILKDDSLEDALSMFQLKEEQKIQAKKDALDPEAAAKRREAEQWRKIKESLGQVDQLPYVNTIDDTPAATAATKTSQGSASSASSLEARGIIIVGGKSDGTFFQTIDDSMNDLRNDPQPETVELLQNQVRAVQEMASESMKAVQLYRQYSDLRTSFRR